MSITAVWSTLHARSRLTGDLAQCIAQLGGDAAVPACYDVRGGVTVVSGVVSQWDDARGAGYGPSLVAAGAARPAWDDANQLVTFDGVDDTLASAFGVAALSLNGIDRTLYVVGYEPVVGGNAYLAAIADATPSRYLALRALSGGSNRYGAIYSGTAVASLVAGSNTTRRLLIAGGVVSGGTVSVAVPGQARVSAAGASAATALNYGLTLGSLASAAGTFGNAVLRAVLVVNRAPSVADDALVMAWAQAQHGVVLA